MDGHSHIRALAWLILGSLGAAVAVLFVGLLVGSLGGCVSDNYSAQVEDPAGGTPWATVVCIPGTGGGFAACDLMAPELLNGGLRVIRTTYPGLSGLDCPGIEAKAATIQALVSADVVGNLYLLGGSQGAWIAGQMQADAAILYSTGLEVVGAEIGGVVVPVPISLPCNANAKPTRVLVLTGEHDEVYAAPIAPQLAAIAGPDGQPGYGPRGWVLVLDAETVNGAGHGIDNDPAWAASQHAWGMAGNIDWLLGAM